MDGDAAVAHLIFFFDGHFCKRLFKSFGDEDRIVAETSGAFSLVRNVSANYTLKAIKLIEADECDDCSELCLSV